MHSAITKSVLFVVFHLTNGILNPQKEITGIFETFGYSPSCVAQALATCENTAPSGNTKSVFRPVNCAELFANGDNISGIKTVYPFAWNLTIPVSVFYDQKNSGGGWTVIQRREYDTIRENFYRPLEEYVSGFGYVLDEFWLGLDIIYALVNPNANELKIYLEDFEGGKRWARYGVFHIGDSKSNYVLSIANYSGNAGDSLAYHNGMQFSTHDADHDLKPDGNCAKEFHGGWWYNNCHHSNLNGFQHVGEDHTSNSDGIHWKEFRGLNYSLKKTVLSVRPKYKINIIKN